MKITPAQLTQQLHQSLAPIYLVHGDEILLVQETIDAIKKVAQSAGFTERVSCHIDSGADWAKHLYSDTHTISLFGEKKIVEFNLNNIKLNAANHKILEEYTKSITPNTLVILSSAKLDTKIEKTTWYKTIEKQGVIVTLWPIHADQLPSWIVQRAKKLNITITQKGAEYLASQMEGHLLAAAQEIEKLALLQPNGTLDEKTIADIVTDNARFDIFTLIDNTLSGKTVRSLRILKNLSDEDTEPTLILWAFTRELRTLAEIKKQSTSNTLAHLFASFRIWEKRQPAVKAALQRFELSEFWDFILDANKIDQIIKGVESGNVWDALEKLVIKLSHKSTYTTGQSI